MSRSAEEALFEWCKRKIEDLEVDEGEIFD